MNARGKPSEPLSPPVAWEQLGPRKPSTRRPKILIVDDRKENLVALRQVLSDVDASVIDATSGNEALATTLDHEFALAIVDVYMPGMNGYELAELLRGDSRTRHLPIIFMTAAYGEEEQVFKGYEAGAVDYIVKPYHPPMLRSKVNVFLELNRKTVDLAAKAEALRQSEERLREVAENLSDADRRKDEFLAMLAHELRNPLGALAGALQLLDLPTAGAEQVRAAREVAGRQVHHLQRLIDDLLDISRITHGKVELRITPMDLAEVARRAVEVARPLIKSHGHELNVTLDQDRELSLHADPARIEQIIVNLLTNAAKYTQQGGKIQLMVRPDGEEHLVRVRDTGMGIPRDVLPNIFDLFAQAPRSLARKEGGLGIGLTLVKALVEMHGGTIQVSSVEGQGSEFVVRLPAGSAGKKKIPPQRRSATTAVAPRHILIVDDNEDNAQMLGLLLEFAGHQVEVVHDGQEAIQAVRDRSPDVILLDIGLPGLNGFEVAERIRHDRAIRQPMIIAVSGYGRGDDRRRSEAAGIDAHLVKPVDQSKLESLLELTKC